MNHKYVNIQYPWDGHENPQEPNVPETNHVALYRRTFTVAERLDTARQNGGTVSITFHGMATAIYVWVNGVFVGYGEDGYTPNEFDITEALHDGENVVAVACYEYASASWLEDQDYWRLHGLFRSVELAAQPHVHIEDMKVEADWNPETATGSLDALLAVRNAKNAATVSATLKDLSGNVVWETALAASDETGIVSGSLDVKPWSAESPALYELQVVVIGHDGAIVETATQRVGFRRFRIEDGIMKLNGKRVVFKGADRHEFDAKRGRAITRQDMIDDITFCKRHNINAIRTSHYPNQEYWYDLCDEYGIYLIDETNLETHGSWCLPGDVVTEDSAVPGSKPEWEGACVDRVNSMMKRDYNHASVVIWSLGNESYAGDVFRAMSVHVHELDPNRPVHYEGVTHNRKYDDVTDIESRMYAHADEIEEYLKSDPKKPYISCEYMHAMGNSVGNMDEYVALERYPQYQADLFGISLIRRFLCACPMAMNVSATAAISAIVRAITSLPETVLCSPIARRRQRRKTSSSCMPTCALCRVKPALRSRMTICSFPPPTMCSLRACLRMASRYGRPNSVLMCRLAKPSTSILNGRWRPTEAKPTSSRSK